MPDIGGHRVSAHQPGCSEVQAPPHRLLGCRPSHGFESCGSERWAAKHGLVFFRYPGLSPEGPPRGHGPLSGSRALLARSGHIQRAGGLASSPKRPARPTRQPVYWHSDAPAAGAPPTLLPLHPSGRPGGRAGETLCSRSPATASTRLPTDLRGARASRETGKGDDAQWRRTKPSVGCNEGHRAGPRGSTRTSARTGGHPHRGASERGRGPGPLRRPPGAHRRAGPEAHWRSGGVAGATSRLGTTPRFSTAPPGTSGRVAKAPHVGAPNRCAAEAGGTSSPSAFRPAEVPRATRCRGSS